MPVIRRFCPARVTGSQWQRLGVNMVVGDDEVAALRALLAGDIAQYLRRYAELDADATRLTYKALIMAAFAEIVDRRFGREVSWSDVVAFITAARQASGPAAARLDPVVAERAVMAVHTDETTDDIDGQELLTTKLLLLAAIGADLRYDDARLDEFLAAVRATADRLLA